MNKLTKPKRFGIASITTVLAVLLIGVVFYWTNYYSDQAWDKEITLVH
jgi:hypothetical protein